MKTIILCGGFGTRLSEETEARPKPMVEINGRPILWHLMKCYENHGFTDFTIALGYKSDVVKDYFTNFHTRANDLSVNLGTGEIKVCATEKYEWLVDLVYTGHNTMTGGRLLRLKDKIGRNERFFMTYGDGLANVDLNALLDFHVAQGKLATVTTVRPTARFGEITIKDNLVQTFKEKPQSSIGRINGGFFVMEPDIFNYIKGDDTILEKDPLEALTSDGQLSAFKHDGYWQCMDTKRDRDMLERLATSETPPWLRTIENV